MLFIYYENSIFAELVWMLQRIFINMNVECSITNNIEKETRDDDLYIIFGIHDYHSQIVPKYYIVYQLEQTTGNSISKYFNDKYLKYLNNAVEVWDYSIVNYLSLTNNTKFTNKNLYYKPMSYFDISEYMNVSKFIIKEQYLNWNNKDIDVLFYGTLNDRRTEIINNMRNIGLKVEIMETTNKNDAHGYFSRSKIVINIHYFPVSILEIVRLSYILCWKSVTNDTIEIVSESSCDKLLDKEYSKYVHICDTNELISTISDVLNKKNKKKIDFKESENFAVKFSDFKDKFNFFFKNSNPLSPLSSLSPLSPRTQDIKYIDKDDIIYSKCFKSELPSISLITITYNRKDKFSLPISNYTNFNYPKNKIEWIIVDDSDSYDSMKDILPKDLNIKYYRLKTTGRLTIGQKRNYGVNEASFDYIVFMDDDDYYFPDSVKNRINVLINYPEYDLVGVNKLFVHDMNKNCSFLLNSSSSDIISEASFAFRKSMFKERKFNEEFDKYGEGYSFIKGRLNKCVCIPSQYVIIALTHKTNYTGNIRTGECNENVNLLEALDLTTQLLISKLYLTF